MRKVSVGRADYWVEIVKNIAKSLVLGHSERLIGLHDPPHELPLKHIFVELLL